MKRYGWWHALLIVLAGLLVLEPIFITGTLAVNPWSGKRQPMKKENLQ